MKSKKSQIRVVASSVTGLYHQNKDMPCQDYFKYACRGKRFVAVVSDGAGSARYGKIGARIICETLCDLLISGAMTDLRQKVIDAIGVARRKILLHRFNKGKSENGLIDFSATVVGAIYTPAGGLFFHIGDGAGIAFPTHKGEDFVISRPENGLFACETYFYTMEDWRDSLRFTPFRSSSALMLMTDGVTGFAFRNDYTELENGFVEPIHRFLSDETSGSRARLALNKTLSLPKACRLNPDDKTLLWVNLR